MDDRQDNETQSDSVAEAAPQNPDAPPATAASGNTQLEANVVEVLKTIYDPEIPVDIYELGLIYKVKADDQGGIDVEMTLTSPACPVAGSLPGEVEMKVRGVEGVTAARVELVWDPPWDKDMMSEAAQLKLGFF